MARITKPLSDTEIRKSKIKEKEYKLSDGNGLYLVIRPNGTKFFRYDYMFYKKRKSINDDEEVIVLIIAIGKRNNLEVYKQADERINE